MKHNKGFIKGALLGALTMLLIMSLTSCGIINTAVGLFTGKVFSSKSSGDQKTDIDTASADSKLELLDKMVDTYYWGDVEEDDLQEGIYKGYISGLGDPYSVYYDEEETKEMEESASGEYSGIGAVLTQDMNTGIITVTRVYEGSPADEAGVKAEDIISKVDDLDVTNMDLTEAVSHIRGEEGTKVTLTLVRNGKDEVETVATRRKITVETVEHEMKENKIGYILVSEFDDVTYKQYKEALEDLESQGMKGLVVDLRSNPGGNLDIVVDILDLMLPEGTVVSMKDKGNKETVFPSDEEHKFEKPLAVLVNGYSASASEIYAGAIQDYGTGEIVGTKTFGKGIVQQIFDLRDGTSLKLTIAEYFTPSGRSIHEKGVEPDIEIEYEPDEENPEYDNQLEEALKVVGEKIK